MRNLLIDIYLQSHKNVTVTRLAHRVDNRFSIRRVRVMDIAVSFLEKFKYGNRNRWNGLTTLRDMDLSLPMTAAKIFSPISLQLKWMVSRRWNKASVSHSTWKKAKKANRLTTSNPPNKIRFWLNEGSSRSSFIFPLLSWHRISELPSSPLLLYFSRACNMLAQPIRSNSWWKASRFLSKLPPTTPAGKKGLMFRKHLPENSGMLFVMDRSDAVCMWMKKHPHPAFRCLHR